MSVFETSALTAPTVAGRPPADTGRLEIVIVDVNAGDAQLTAELLRPHHPALRLATYEHVEDATRALAGSTADCVLLDLGPADADADGTGGLDGLDQLLGVAPGIPVVVLTGADDERLGLAAVRRGAQDYATKCERDAAPLWRTINRAIERAHVTRELIRRANQDSLTGLPNRALFVQRVDQAIARSRRWATGFTVIFVEVDDFKSINDNFGHATGDDVLREISRRFLSGLGDGDTPCRYAGVAFAAICHAADRADATRVARRVQESICREPVVSGVRSFKIGVSIGVALGAGDDHAETLMHRVDGAIYEAKLTGAVCVVD